MKTSKAKKTPKARAAEVKEIRLKVRTTLANATLRIYADAAAEKIIAWARGGGTESLSPIVDDPNIALVTRRAQVQAVGKR